MATAVTVTHWHIQPIYRLPILDSHWQWLVTKLLSNTRWQNTGWAQLSTSLQLSKETFLVKSKGEESKKWRRENRPHREARHGEWAIFRVLQGAKDCTRWGMGWFRWGVAAASSDYVQSYWESTVRYVVESPFRLTLPLPGQRKPSMLSSGVSTSRHWATWYSKIKEYLLPFKFPGTIQIFDFLISVELLKVPRWLSVAVQRTQESFEEITRVQKISFLSCLRNRSGTSVSVSAGSLPMSLTGKRLSSRGRQYVTTSVSWRWASS